MVSHPDLPTAVDPKVAPVGGADMGGEIFVITGEVEVEVTGVTEAVATGEVATAEVATLAVAIRVGIRKKRRQLAGLDFVCWNKYIRE